MAARWRRAARAAAAAAGLLALAAGGAVGAEPGPGPGSPAPGVGAEPGPAPAAAVRGAGAHAAGAVGAAGRRSGPESGRGASSQEADTVPAGAEGEQQIQELAREEGEARPLWLRLLRGALGLSAILALAWLFSARRGAVRWAQVGKGLLLQLVFAVLVLETGWGRTFFRMVNDVFVALIGFTNDGARFLFGSLVQSQVPVSGGSGVVEVGANFAFSVLPTIIFFSSLMTLLYHMGAMQKVVKGMAWLMQRSLRTSGAETVSAAGNIFVGQTEAPLMIKPFVKDMTMSELNTIMTCGFATVAGGVMAAYVAMLSRQFPDIAGHLLAATIMSAPAGIVVSKILWPETEETVTGSDVQVQVEEEHANLIDAAAGGAADGLRLALNVGAMLLAFLALIAMANGILGWAGGHLGFPGLTLEKIFGWVFAPAAWVIGVPWGDAAQVGSLLGIKMVANEFVAFQTLSEMLAGETALRVRSVVITTYALTGFANFSSIAIQIGGIGGIAPSRRSDLSRLGVRAMLGGTAATWMTAVFAGVLV